jgi:iron-sulfur cluster assembly protein
MQTSELPQANPTPVVTVTQLAATKVREFMQKEGKSTGALRVYVTGGGCSGLSYGLALEDQVGDDDIVVEAYDVKVLVDAFSAKYLKGSKIDYLESLEGSGFKIDNPNVTSSCACGHSFHAGQE